MARYIRRIGSSILKLLYNGINKENMPANLKFELKETIVPNNHRERQKHE